MPSIEKKNQLFKPYCYTTRGKIESKITFFYLVLIDIWKTTLTVNIRIFLGLMDVTFSDVTSSNVISYTMFKIDRKMKPSSLWSRLVSIERVSKGYSNVGY